MIKYITPPLIAYAFLACVVAFTFNEVLDETQERRRAIVTATERALYEGCTRDNLDRTVVLQILNDFARIGPRTEARLEAHERAARLLLPLDCKKIVEDADLEEGI